MTYSLSPQEAWQPLAENEWNAEAARHLLRRAGWTALPAEVRRATQEGLAATLDRLFPAEPIFIPEPASIERLAEELPTRHERLAQAPPEERRALYRQERERSQAALLDLSLAWLQFAAEPANAAFEKWVLFLSDVYVVASEKVNLAPLIYWHFDLIARHALGPAPVLTKAISRSPAMVQYLDLGQNRREAPNENFARELFELFLLGEGNYTERDIKEAARAFTGYRLHPQVGFVYAPRQHDDGAKTVFGHTGDFTGDQVIDLAYTLPAAGAFLPHEMVKFYLADAMIPPEYLLALGDRWRAADYNLRWLALAFFGSRMFFAPEFRGEFIKSPVQLYLGLVQDMSLDVIPLPRYVINPLRQMGQTLYNPPNVRGWVGGRNWINSTSLAARRTLIETLFHPIREDNLTADERAVVVAARAEHRGDFIVGDDRLAPLAGLDPDEVVRSLAGGLLSTPADASFREALRNFIASAGANPREQQRRLRRALITLLESPEYQLC